MDVLALYNQSVVSNFVTDTNINLGSASISDPTTQRIFGISQDDDIPGLVMDEWESLKVPAYWRCIDFLSNLVASVPFHVMEVGADGGSEPSTSHRAYRVLHTRPHPLLTPYYWKRVVMFHALNWGNYFARIVHDANGNPVRFDTIDPTVVVLGKTKDGRIMYAYPTTGGKTVMVRPENMFHVHGLSFDGFWGLRPLEYWSLQTGKAKAQHKHSRKWFGNSANPSGIVRAPSGLAPDKLERFKETFSQAYVALGNSSKVLLLEDDAEFTPISVDPQKSQMNESIAMSDRQIANLFGCPPSTVNAPEANSYASLEIQKQDELDAASPWVQNIQEVCDLKFIRPNEEGRFRVRGRTEVIKVVDHKTGVESALKEIEGGTLLINEYRNSRDRPDLDDELNQARMPANSTFAFTRLNVTTGQPDDSDEGDVETDDEQVESLRVLTNRATKGSVHRFLEKITGALKSTDTILSFLESEHVEYLDRFKADMSLVVSAGGCNVKATALNAWVFETLFWLRTSVEVDSLESISDEFETRSAIMIEEIINAA